MACITKTTMKPICVLSYALLHITIFACSITIVSIILLPRSPDIEYNRVVVNENDNDSSINDFNEWPFKIKVRPENFFCSWPNPNFDVTDEQLTDAWFLPKNSALSPLMRDVGRCKVASKSLHKFDDRKCNCVVIWWVAVVLVIAIADLASSLLFYGMCCGAGVEFCVSGLPSATGGNTTDANRDYLIYCNWCIAWSVLWLIAAVFYVMRDTAIGIWYTAYGDILAQAYYNKEPTQWFIIWVLCMIQFAAEAAKALSFWFALKKEPTNQSSTNADPPPPYKSLGFAKV